MNIFQYFRFWLLYHVVAILGLAVGGTSLMLHFIINVKKVNETYCVPYDIP